MNKIEFIFEQTCLRKSNLTEKQANDFIDFALKERNLLLYYYKCPYCSSIHLTKKEPRDFEALKVI